jgi:hypothetical protein
MEKPIPAGLVKRIVRFRVKENKQRERQMLKSPSALLLVKRQPTKKNKRDAEKGIQRTVDSGCPAPRSSAAAGKLKI